MRELFVGLECEIQSLSHVLSVKYAGETVSKTSVIREKIYRWILIQDNPDTIPRHAISFSMLLIF